ncbi:MAG: ABC transporter ATP-binding protein/permease [Chloroflexi bacterium]|nr:ABC transporter ATP-binding protein/permease [Chloroflexota bacterium]MCC6894705.1 ABC transporter ATP-binding protein [Anaerolineae bacterium]
MHGGGWWVYAWGGESDKDKQNVTWPLVKRVLNYARPYWGKIAITLVTILITTGLGLLTPLIFRDLIDNALPQGDAQRLNVLALGLVLIPIAVSLVGMYSRLLNAQIGEGVIFDLRTALYNHMQRMSLRFFTNTKVGELMSRLNNDVVNAQSAISDTIVTMVVNVVQVVAVLGVMLTLDWRLTVMSVAVLPVFIFIARKRGGSLRGIRRQGMEYNAQMNAMMNETLNIGGTLLVKLFGRGQMETERFANRAGKVRDIGVQEAFYGNQFWVIVGMVGVVGTAVVYWVGGHLVLDGVFSIGTIVAFSAYLGQLYGPLQSLTNSPVIFARSMVSFERVFEVIDLPVEVVEKPGATVLQDVRGELTFEDVTFTYDTNADNLLSEVNRPGRMENVKNALSLDTTNGKPAKPELDVEAEKPYTQARETALDHVSFTIKPGQLVALVGPSGAGKTTMTYLIPRLYDPSEGRILIDGIDLRDVTLDSLARQIGMVTQETHLFHDTIRTNLLYAKVDATQAEIEAACKAANIHDFIMGLPDGYDSVVGERGYRLSGGEKQRLAIARVILKNPRILVLDEATSHLDSQSEALIQDALKTVMDGRTSLVIAHRLSTILAADQILVMDRGQVAEQGTHAALLAKGGLYANLYETQFKGERELA